MFLVTYSYSVACYGPLEKIKMFYHFLVYLNLFYGIFGFWKPFKSPSKNVIIVIWRKIWPIIVISCMVVNSIESLKAIDLNIKNNLSPLVYLNQLVFNAGIILIEMTNNNNVCVILYQTINKCYASLRVSERNLKNLAYKLYFWFLVLVIILTGTIIIEILIAGKPPFMLLIKLPSFLAISHLMIHLYLILSILHLVNNCLSRTLLLSDDNLKTTEKLTQKGVTKICYLMNINECFIDHDQMNQHHDIQFLFRIYDDIGTCMKLLEKYHALQMLLAIWLMFSDAVAGIPLVTSQQAKYPSVIITNAGLAFLWFTMACCIQDQIRKEVEKTDILLIKHLIDFRCNHLRKSTLQSFKQLVGTERLKFTACSLFELNYAMIVGTVLNIVTYSIILIQLLASK